MRAAGGIALALCLAIAAVVLLLARPLPEPTPLTVPDLGALTVEDVTFESDGLTLSGQLFRPQTTSAAALILPEPGDGGRGDPWTLQMVEALTGAGVAVLLPDLRGTDGADGDWRTASPEALARDARLAMDLVRARVPGVPLTLLGLGRGGEIAPLAANGPRPPDRILSLSGDVMPATEALAFRTENALRRRGLPDALARILAPLVAWHRREVQDPVFWAVTGDFDPVEHWAQVEVPALILLGALDRDDRIDVAAAAPRIEALDAPGIEVRVLPGLDHRLRVPGEKRVSDAVLETIAGFAGSGRL